jgi:hypothetical protein
LAVGAFALEDVRTVGPVLVATVPAAQDVYILIVVRAGQVSGADHDLSVAVPITWLGRPFAHNGQYTYPRFRDT